MCSVCKVCGDEANINNYGALSCQSCKIFFRRNAFQPKLVRPCQYYGNCEINIITRKYCAACRLDKCFAIGMKSHLIRKEDRSVKKKSVILIEYHRNQHSLTTPQWKLLSNVLYAFDRFSLDLMSYSIVDTFKFLDSIYTSSQLFVCSTPDYQVLDMNEQKSLLERNLHTISSVSADIYLCNNYLFQNAQCPNSYLFIYGIEIMKRTKLFFERFNFDSKVVKIFCFVISFCSNCFVVDICKRTLNDSFRMGTFRLFGSQNVYIEILWKYMIYQYGFVNSIVRFTQLTEYILNKIKELSDVYENNEIYRHYVDYIMKKNLDELQPISLWGKT